MPFLRRRARLAWGIAERAAWALHLKLYPDPCQGVHDPLVLTLTPSGERLLICRVCTENLPRPWWMTCDDCVPIEVDGWLEVVFCSRHVQQDVPAEGRPA